MIGGGLYLATISFDELSFTSASGISNKELNESLQIFPNPGSSTVYITPLDFSLNQADIEICDMAGRIIARNKGIKMVSTNCFFPETDKKVKIELGSIPKGVYYIVISSTKGNYSRLLIRQ